MPRPRKPHTHQEQPTKQKTPTFLLELPLAVTPGQARRLRARLEAARQLYNAVLSEGQRRLRHMRADPAWQKARAIPRAQKRERTHAFAALRQAYGFSEYALHAAAQGLNCSWIATHVDAVLAQTLASRAYRALNRVRLGQARRVRFRSRSRGISSVENKRHASQWAFAEVRRFLEYKAVLSGSLCVKVDADYTSQACPHCGYISRENRPKKGLLFVCQCCQYTLHADLIGARNISLRTLAIRQDWMATGHLSDAPDVTDAEAKAARRHRYAELRWSPATSPLL